MEGTFSLNAQDIFSPLSMQGLDEAVMAFIDTDNDRIVPSVKQEPDATEDEEAQ